MHIHHIIPKEYRYLFGNAIDNLSNLQALPAKLHHQVTGAWNSWRAINPNPTQAQVHEMKRMMQSIIGEHANNVNSIINF